MKKIFTCLLLFIAASGCQPFLIVEYDAFTKKKEIITGVKIVRQKDIAGQKVGGGSTLQITNTAADTVLRYSDPFNRPYIIDDYSKNAIVMLSDGTTFEAGLTRQNTKTLTGNGETFYVGCKLNAQQLQQIKAKGIMAVRYPTDSDFEQPLLHKKTSKHTRKMAAYMLSADKLKITTKENWWE